MAYRSDWIRLIRQLAQKYGVDPQAALAVASQEGLGGGVGDSGTSFGPFQLHRGGALPSGQTQGWAESPQGLDYAMRQIGGVAKGLHGNQAVQSIVSRFERPKDAQGEIARAIQAYSQFGGAAQAGGPRPLSLPPQGAAASAPDPRQSILRTLASGRDVDFVGLARQAMLQRQQPAVNPAAAQAGPQTASPGLALAPGGGKPGHVEPALLSLAKRFGLQITSGYRSSAEQAQIYAHRSSAGSVAAPGRSWHQFGRAVDVAPTAQAIAAYHYALKHPEQFKEAFFDPAGVYIKNGKVVKGKIGGHSDHIHFAI